MGSPPRWEFWRWGLGAEDVAGGGGVAAVGGGLGVAGGGSGFGRGCGGVDGDGPLVGFGSFGWGLRGEG